MGVSKKVNELKEPNVVDMRQRPTLKVVLLGDSGVGKTCLRSQLVHRVFSNAYKATIGGDFLTTTVEIAPEQNTNTSSSMILNSSSSLSSSSRSNSSLNSNSNSNPCFGKQSCDRDTSDTSPEPTHTQHAKSVSLQVWDTAGQERFNSITKAFYRGADVALLVYDITNYESLLSIRDWFSRFLQHCQVDHPGIIIVGNKNDKHAERAVDKQEVQEILCRNDTLRLSDHVKDWTEDVLEISCKSMVSVEAVFKRAAIIGLSKKSMDKRNHRYSGSGTSIRLDETQAASSSCAC